MHCIIIQNEVHHSKKIKNVKKINRSEVLLGNQVVCIYLELSVNIKFSPFLPDEDKFSLPIDFSLEMAFLGWVEYFFSPIS